MEISKAVVRLVAEESGCDATEDTPFAELPFDSLDMLDLLVKVEDETGVRVPPDWLGEMVNVGDLVRLVSTDLWARKEGIE